MQSTLAELLSSTLTADRATVVGRRGEFVALLQREAEVSKRESAASREELKRSVALLSSWCRNRETELSDGDELRGTFALFFFIGPSSRKAKTGLHI